MLARVDQILLDPVAQRHSDGVEADVMHLLDIGRRDPIGPMVLEDAVGLALSELAHAIKFRAR